MNIIAWLPTVEGTKHLIEVRGTGSLITGKSLINGSSLKCLYHVAIPTDVSLLKLSISSTEYEARPRSAGLQRMTTNV